MYLFCKETEDGVVAQQNKVTIARDLPNIKGQNIQRKSNSVAHGLVQYCRRVLCTALRVEAGLARL